MAAVQLCKLAGAATLYTAFGDDELGHRAKRELEGFVLRVEAAFRPKPQRRGFVHIDQAGGSRCGVPDHRYVLHKVQAGRANRILAYLGSEHLVVERDMGEKSYLVRVTTQTGRNPVRTANAAALRTDVEYAEPNLVRPLNRFAFIPTDELFVRQWHLHAPSPARDLVAGSGCSPEASDITRGTRGVVVAVADDGFDLSHPDFQGEGKVVVRLNATPSGNAAIAWDANVSPRPATITGRRVWESLSRKEMAVAS